MQSLKGYTARKCNQALGREGAFWQHESFDRVIRDQEEFARTVNYVLNNPVNARMVTCWRDWRWSYCAPLFVEAGLVR
jgi:putative transposase